MNMVKKTYVLLGSIVVFAFFLRFLFVPSVPPALSWDEVSIGYNAWSVLQTGKDEHGRLLPLDTFVAYGDYKPPIAIYLTVPFIALFGLSEFAVRLPVVLFSTATVLLTYFLVKELFPLYTYKRSLALVVSLLLALSPWHINLSRAGFEAVIALFFVVAGIVLTLKSRSIKRLQFFVWIPFILSLYTFNSSRYFVILFSPVLFCYAFQSELEVLFRTIKKRKHPSYELSQWLLRILVSFGIALLIMLPILPHLVSREARLRFTEVNIFSDDQVVKTANERIAYAKDTWWANILNNRRVGYGLSYIRHYLDHFDPTFLFIKGDGNPKFSVQDVGQLYAIEAVFLVIGLYALFRIQKRTALFVILWLLISIVPAAVARETPHALRILNSLPTWQIIIGCGIVWSYYAIRSKTIQKIFSIIVVLIYAVLVSYYLHTYYAHYSNEYSGEWQYGYREAIVETELRKDNYDAIVVSDVIGRPYMYTLFYGKYDPEYFWKTKKSYTDAAGFYHVDGFGKYLFVEDVLPERTGKTLYVLPPWQVPENATVIKRIHLLNGNEVLTVFE